MVNIATREPEAFVAGDTVEWTRSFGDYPPADGWVLSYVFTSIVGQFPATGADNGDGKFLVTLDAATTASIIEGSYTWQGAVTLSTIRHTIGTGLTQVAPDLLASPASRDTRGHNRIVLDAIESVIEQTATTDQASYSVDGISLSRMPWADLLSTRDRYRALVAREEAADRISKGLGHPSRLLVRL